MVVGMNPRWRRIPVMVRVVTIGQSLFALAVMAIVSAGIARTDYAPYQPAFFSALAGAVEQGTLSAEQRRTVIEVIDQFPREVNGALQLSRQADHTTLAVAACMLLLPLVLLLGSHTTHKPDRDAGP